jgi:hypothetical protein
VCHLNNHEPLDRERLRRVLDEDNPFLSAVTRSWERREDCPDLTLSDALQAFIRERADTVAWLRTLDAAAWERPARDAIFGPTSFEELVRFVLAHDRTHINQMQNAIAAAMSSASPA